MRLSKEEAFPWRRHPAGDLTHLHIVQKRRRDAGATRRGTPHSFRWWVSELQR